MKTNRPNNPNADDSAINDSKTSRAITILVADDDSDMRLYMIQCLKSVRKNMTVLEAVDGWEALTQLQQNNVDLLITDIVMPRMDGLELCRAIQQDADLNHISILLVTGELPAREIRERIDAFDYIEALSKPFNAEQLRSKVTELIDRFRNLPKSQRKPENP